jgi:hypothetical protein
MDRRSLLTGLTASTLAGSVRAAADVPVEGWRRFELTTAVDLADQAAPVTVWLPLAGGVGPYQKGLGRRFDTNGHARVVRDARYREPVLKVSWDAPGPRKVTVVETL